jgi:hypothetical protein
LAALRAVGCGVEFWGQRRGSVDGEGRDERELLGTQATCGDQLPCCQYGSHAASRPQPAEGPRWRRRSGLQCSLNVTYLVWLEVVVNKIILIIVAIYIYSRLFIVQLACLYVSNIWSNSYLKLCASRLNGENREGEGRASFVATSN